MVIVFKAKGMQKVTQKADTKIDAAEARRVTKKFVAIFGGIFMFVGGATLIGSVYNITLAKLSNDWPTVKGVILESKVVSARELASADSNSYVTVYSPLIRYQYEIEGTLYENDTIRFSGIGGTDGNESRQLVHQFPVTKKINVYYSPSDKQNSVLVRGVELKTNIGAIIAGVLFFLMGFLFYKLRNVYAESIPD